MSLQIGKCIVHRSFISPDDKIDTRIRFQTSMWHSSNGQRIPLIRTFEATLQEISTQRNLDEGDPQYVFVLDETPDSAAIIKEFRRMHKEDCENTLATWADDPDISPMMQELTSKPPVFRLETSAQYIFAEGDRVTLHIPSTSHLHISEPLGYIADLEVID